MAKPLNNFEWATNPNYTTGPDVGTPTKLAPSAGEIDEGFVPETAAIPQHVNWALSEISEWTEYLAGIESDSEFLSNSLHFTNDFQIDGRLDAGELDLDTDIYVGGTIRQATKTIVKVIPLSHIAVYGTGARVLTATGLQLYNGLSACSLWLDLPIGSTLNRVRVGVKSTGFASTAPINMSLQRVTYDTAAPTSANTQVSAGTDTAVPGTYDILDIAVSGPVNATSHLIVNLNGGTDGDTGDRDIILWVEVTYATNHADENA